MCAHACVCVYMHVCVCVCVCVYRSTIADDLPPLALQVLRAVSLEGRDSPQLPEAVEEGLLLLLGVGCQHLLGQTQFLVRLPLLVGRGHGTRGRAGGLVPIGHLLYDLCTDDR